VRGEKAAAARGEEEEDDKDCRAPAVVEASAADGRGDTDDNLPGDMPIAPTDPAFQDIWCDTEIGSGGRKDLISAEPRKRPKVELNCWD
jgi:hypothetical protein